MVLLSSNHIAGHHGPETSAPVSVLMATYAGERADWLAASLESVFSQTLKPRQLVLVLDGPVPRDQEEVIRHYQADPRIAEVRICRLSQNGGLARALNAGLALCSCPWIARMDSDDLCVPERIAVQMNYILGEPGAEIVSSWTEEFVDGEDQRRLKSSPVRHEHIVRSLRWRNILVHPSLFISADLLRQVGGYRSHFGKLEDYDLFVRLTLAGARFHVLPTVLVRMRSGLHQSARRGGIGYLINELRFRLFCLRSGFLTPRQFIGVTCAYTAFRLAGAPLRARLYRLARV